MILSLIALFGALAILGGALWVLAVALREPEGEDWSLRLMRPRPPEGFENLSAAEFETTEIEFMDEEFGVDDLGFLDDRKPAEQQENRAP